jgi:hypothetical protein
VLDLRLDHGEKRRLLQVQQLRHHERLRLTGNSKTPDCLQFGCKRLTETRAGRNPGPFFDP